MGRLKLFGEPEGGGTSDHSALSNLGYAQSGHTGFVPSQGEALIEILRLTQNLIRDSGGNDRITLSAISPHLTLTGDPMITGSLGVKGSIPIDSEWIRVNPQITVPVSGCTAVSIGPTVTMSNNYPIFTALAGASTVKLTGAPTEAQVRGLVFGSTIWLDSRLSATVAEQAGIWVYSNLLNFGTSLVVTDAYGLRITAPLALNASVTRYKGLYAEGGAMNYVGTAYGLHLEDITGAAAVRLLEIGPSTPYLRLVGGANPPADKSNLYLKFGSTLYRVVKSGNQVTLEAA